MAFGVPVVAPDYPPITEVFDGQGICFVKNDVHSLSAALTKMITDAALNKKFGHRGKELVHTRHNWQSNADQTLQALASSTGLGLDNKLVTK